MAVVKSIWLLLVLAVCIKETLQATEKIHYIGDKPPEKKNEKKVEHTDDMTTEQAKQKMNKLYEKMEREQDHKRKQKERYDFEREEDEGDYDPADYPESELEKQIKAARLRGPPLPKAPNDSVAPVWDWPLPEYKIRLGQVAGIAIDPDDNPVLFHRGNRTYNRFSFDGYNNFRFKNNGPIRLSTIIVLNKTNGKVIRKWGKNRFYLPHGLEIDKKGNYYITDLALHQVMRFPPNSEEPDLVLGKAFLPARHNKDEERFCQPTDVQVESNGDFYVSDGYCANRIFKFAKNGSVIKVFGPEDPFKVPHAMALAEDQDLLCVADRENKRLLCLNTGKAKAKELGKPEIEYDYDIISRAFGMTYTTVPPYGKDKAMYVVNGISGHQLIQGFTVPLFKEVREVKLKKWSPNGNGTGFTTPHDVEVSSDGQTIYVGELAGSHRIWKFERFTPPPEPEKPKKKKKKTRGKRDTKAERSGRKRRSTRARRGAYSRGDWRDRDRDDRPFRKRPRRGRYHEGKPVRSPKDSRGAKKFSARARKAAEKLRAEKAKAEKARKQYKSQYPGVPPPDGELPPEVQKYVDNMQASMREHKQEKEAAEKEEKAAKQREVEEARREAEERDREKTRKMAEKAEQIRQKLASEKAARKEKIKTHGKTSADETEEEVLERKKISTVDKEKREKRAATKEHGSKRDTREVDKESKRDKRATEDTEVKRDKTATENKEVKRQKRATVEKEAKREKRATDDKEVKREKRAAEDKEVKREKRETEEQEAKREKKATENKELKREKRSMDEKQTEREKRAADKKEEKREKQATQEKKPIRGKKETKAETVN